MKPTATQLVDSALYSLREVVIPAVEDDWALYVAKCMDKLLVTVRTRMEHELEHLAVDLAEMEALFADVASRTAQVPGCDDLTLALTGPGLDPPIAPEAAADLLSRTQEADDLARTRLDALIAALFALEDAHLPEPAAGTVRDVHADVRRLIDRQLERDIHLSAPMFMAFGAPPPASAGIAS